MMPPPPPVGPSYWQARRRCQRLCPRTRRWVCARSRPRVKRRFSWPSNTGLGARMDSHSSYRGNLASERKQSETCGTYARGPARQHRFGPLQTMPSLCASTPRRMLPPSAALDARPCIKRRGQSVLTPLRHHTRRPILRCHQKNTLVK